MRYTFNTETWFCHCYSGETIETLNGGVSGEMKRVNV